MRGGGSQIKAPTLKLWRQLYPKRTPNPDLRVFLSPKPRPIRRRKGKSPTMKIENGMPLMLEEMIPHEERGWRPASLGECAAEIERLREHIFSLNDHFNQLPDNAITAAHRAAMKRALAAARTPSQ